MKTRIISAAVAIVVALTLIILGSLFSIVITIAISLISALLCGEYLSARKLNKNMIPFIVCLVFAFLIPMLSMTVVKYVPVFLFILSVCVYLVVFNKSVKTDDAIFALAGVTLISVSLSLLNVVACTDQPHSAFWLVFTLGVPWLADSSAYFAGSYLGKRKLCPDISPNKTVEGAIAGVIGGTLASLLIGLIFQLIYGQVTIYYGYLLIIGLLSSAVSIIGDLTFSVIKRSCKIKDFGSIMPGHGGMLDRFDSVLLCIPIVYIFSQFVFLIV